MDTARRSSRAARTSQPLQSTSQHSSASSNSSGRADRATRSHIKADSPRNPTPSASLSSDPDDAIRAAVEESMQTRRKRARAEEQIKPSKEQPVQAEVTNGADEVGEDDEAVRCICGLDDYPGPPQVAEEDSKAGIREGIEEPIITPADVTEDLAGFYLQCDMCKVWQHGGCVGIMNEEQSPDEYFCEQCRNDLHKIFTASNGYAWFQLLELLYCLAIGFPRLSAPNAIAWRRRSLTRLAGCLQAQNIWNTSIFQIQHKNRLLTRWNAGNAIRIIYPSTKHCRGPLREQHLSRRMARGPPEAAKVAGLPPVFRVQKDGRR